MSWLSKVIRKVLGIKTPKVPKTYSSERLSAILDPDYDVPVCYGETRTDGNIIDYDVTGDKNKYLDIVVLICEGEIEGFTKVYMDDGAIPLFDGAGSTITSETKVYSTNPLYGARKATGGLVVDSDYSNLKNGYLIAVGEYVLTGGAPFGPGTVTTLTVGTEFALGANMSATLTNLVNYLNSSADSNISKATYTLHTDGRGFDVEYDTAGSVGNDFKVGIFYDYFGTFETFGRIADVKLSGGADDYYVEAYFYNGRDDHTANSQLVTNYLPTSDNSGWTSAHTLNGFAYMYVRMLHNEDLFSGSIPKFSFELKGRKVYDPRTSTTVYSDNPVICLRDYLISTRFGKGMDSDDLDVTTLIDAANACDVLRTGKDVTGATIQYKTYTIGATVDTGETIKDNLQRFLQTMNGALPYFDGKYFFKIMAAGNPVVTFDESNIIGGMSIKSSDKRSRFNKVAISFFDKQRHFKKGDAILDSSTYLSEDNGQPLEKRIEAPYVNYYPQARDLAELTMQMSRTGIRASFMTTSEAFKTVAGDIVGITYTPFGWTNKEFRIEKIKSRMDGFCDITALEHDDAFYSLTEKQEQGESGLVSLPETHFIVKPVITTIYSSNKSSITNSDGTVTPRIIVRWQNNDPYAASYNIYLSKVTQTSEFIQVNSPFIKIGNVLDGDELVFNITDIEWNQLYEVGVAVINSYGVKSDMAIAGIRTPNPLGDIADSADDLVYDFPVITGLELIGQGTNLGQGNDFTFTGKDIKLQWRANTSNATFEIGSVQSESAGNVGGIIPVTLSGYRIEVYHPGDALPRSEFRTNQPNFVYTHEQNFEDGNGVPSRTVTFKIYTVGSVAGFGLTGESPNPSIITVTNPAPDALTNISVEPVFQAAIVKADPIVDNDGEGMMVWFSTTTGFTPSEETLVYRGPNMTADIMGLISGQQYYAIVAGYDSFVPITQKDASNLNVSSEIPFETQQAISAEEVAGLSNWATRTTPADLAFIEANIGSSAIPSTQIESVVAGKVAAGTLAARVAVAGVFSATGSSSVLNETGLTAGTWRLDLGPVSEGFDTYVMRWHNGAGTKRFYMDSLGNLTMRGAYFSDDDLTAIGVSGVDKSIWINSSTYGNDGFQVEYNSGNPRIHIGNKNGSGPYMEFDGTNLVTRTLLTSTGSGKRIELNPSGDNEIHFYGDRGDGVIEELATIGVKDIGGDAYIGAFGSASTANNRIALIGRSYSQIGVRGQSHASHGVYGVSDSGNGVRGLSTSNVGVVGQSSTSVAIVANTASTTRGAIRIEPKSDTTDPTSALRGEFYVRSDGVLRFHDGTSWRTVNVT